MYSFLKLCCFIYQVTIKITSGSSNRYTGQMNKKKIWRHYLSNKNQDAEAVSQRLSVSLIASIEIKMQGKCCKCTRLGVRKCDHIYNSKGFGSFLLWNIQVFVYTEPRRTYTAVISEKQLLLPISLWNGYKAIFKLLDLFWLCMVLPHATKAAVS